MRFSTALFSYGISALICLLLPPLFYRFRKRKEEKIKIFHFLTGLCFFIFFLVAYYLVLSSYLSAKGGIADYYNTPAFRIAVITAITVIFSVLLTLFSRGVYTRRQMFRENRSFFIGFGAGMPILVGVYCLSMFLILLFHYVGSTLLAFDDSVRAFLFGGRTYISVFLPMTGHISMAVIAVGFWASCAAFGMCINRTATERALPTWGSVLTNLGVIVGFCIMVDIVCFMTMIAMPHYLLAILMLLVTAWQVFMIRMTYRIKKKTPQEYKKQFTR